MSSNDNLAIKDGNDNAKSMRSKDVSAAGDGSLQRILHFSTMYPVDYGAGGCYHTVVKSGSMAAGLAAGSPILAFRNPSTTLKALVRRIKFNAWTIGTGFAAGLATTELYVARSFTAMDTGGAALTVQGKLATAMAAASSVIQYATTGTLTAGTRTLDTNPVESENVTAPTAAYTPFTSNPLRANIFDKLGSDHPLLLAQNEGFVLQSTVPATGVWGWSCKIEWDEVPLVNY